MKEHYRMDCFMVCSLWIDSFLEVYSFLSILLLEDSNSEKVGLRRELRSRDIVLT